MFGGPTCFLRCPEAYCYSHTVVKVESFGPTPGPLAQSCLEEAESYHCWSWVLDGHVLVINGIINTSCSTHSFREDTVNKYLVIASCVDVATLAGVHSIPSRKENDHYRQIQCSVCCPPGSVN